MIRTSYSKLIHRIGNAVDWSKRVSTAPPSGLWAFARWALAGGWTAILIGTLISMSAGLGEVFTVYLLGQVVDAVGAGSPNGFLADHFWLAMTSVLFLVILRPLFMWGQALTQSVIIGPTISMQSLARLFRWSLGQSVTYFDNDFAGRLAQKQLQTSHSLTEIVIESVNAIAFGAATLIGTAFMLGALSGWILLPFVVWFSLYMGFLKVMLPRIRKRAAARAEAKANVTGQVVDTISNIKTVKLFAGDSHEDDKGLEAMDGLRKRALAFGEVQTVFRFGLILIAGLLPVALVGTAVSLPAGTMTAGSIAAVGAIGIRLSQMTGWISFTLMVIYSHIGEVQDGMATLTTKPDLTDKPEAETLSVPSGEVHYDNVTFAYGREGGGIHDVDLTIAPGEKLAIVGASGAGKSTLVSLLLRLYDTEGGAVRIDGQAVSDVTQASLRQKIGMVTQETAMFNRSAMENIRYGRPEASDEEVMEAARRAEAHGFVLGLQDNRGREGYAAHLGERGVKLSGGQRQRIALARAILKDAPILVLDEATSALDSEVEAQIQIALTRVMEGKTVLAIAHRLSTISGMDRIVVMDQGRIAEVGNHAELLEKGGLYARYWDRQSGGFIGADDPKSPSSDKGSEAAE